jgi:hypothetical protein
MRNEEGWRRQHNEELHNLYASPNIIMVLKSRRIWARHVARMGRQEMHTKFLLEKPEGKRPFRRSRQRRDDDIRMDLREVGWEGVDWMHLAQNRDQWWAVVDTVMKLRVPLKEGKFSTV